MNVDCIFGQHKDYLKEIREMETGSKFVFQCVLCHRIFEYQTIMPKKFAIKKVVVNEKHN